MSSSYSQSHEPIHSGHFMTSDPHTDTTPESEDEVVDVEVRVTVLFWVTVLTVLFKDSTYILLVTVHFIFY